MRGLDSTTNRLPGKRETERPTTVLEGNEEEEPCTATTNMSPSPACSLESPQYLSIAEIDPAANRGPEPLQSQMSLGCAPHSNAGSSPRNASQAGTFSPKEDHQDAGSTCSAGGETPHLSSIACPRKSALQQDAGAPDNQEAVFSDENIGNKEDRRQTLDLGSTLAKGVTAMDKPPPGRTTSYQVGEGSTSKTSLFSKGSQIYCTDISHS